MRLTGAYFDLTDRIAPKSTASDRRGDTAGGPAKKAPMVVKAPVEGDKVLISVAKRLVSSAVRRNTVKRIVREAWRAAIRGSAVRSGPQSMPGVCLMRLKRYPGIGEQTAPGLTMIKQSLRADAEALFTTYLQRRPRQRNVSHVQPSAGPVPVGRSGSL